MVTTEYAIAYNEVLEILKYVSNEELQKIPINMLKMFKDNANKRHIFKYDPDKTLQEQNVTKTTQLIIAILFRDYWSTEEQRERIIKYQNSEEKDIKTSIEEIGANLPAEIKKEGLLGKVKKFFKRLFRKG